MFLFQSTRPRGARHLDLLEKQAGLLFQSTRPRGARHSLYEALADFCVSIHAPARGATQTGKIILANQLFQSTRPRGARPSLADCRT